MKAMVFAVQLMLSTHDPQTGHADVGNIYKDFRHPQENKSCCGMNDCRPVPHEEIGFRSRQYTYKNWTYPREWAQKSPDDQFHVCIVNYQLYCLLVPVMPGT